MAKFLEDEDVLRAIERWKIYDNNEESKTWNEALEFAKRVVMVVRPADAVEITRCKDCRWHIDIDNTTDIKCLDPQRGSVYHNRDWYCGNAKKDIKTEEALKYLSATRKDYHDDKKVQALNKAIEIMKMGLNSCEN